MAFGCNLETYNWQNDGRRMRNWILYCLIFLVASGFHTDKSVLTRWVISNGCSLKVDGSTNVNKFSCAISNYGQPDTILVSRTGGASIPLTGYMMLDVQQFDCKNAVMTADLRKTLKSKTYPKMIIRFLSLGKYPESGPRPFLTKGMVMIELAGVNKKFEVDYKIVSTDRNFINMVGSQKVHFSDFNIDPPTKLGGMIKTNDALSVEFNLKIKVLN